MPQPKLPADLRDRLSRLGLYAMCYQPVSLFKRQPPRSLPNVPRSDDPWHVVLRRSDRVPWANGALVKQAHAETLRGAILAALEDAQGPDLLTVMAKLGSALDGLTGALREAR